MATKKSLKEWKKPYMEQIDLVFDKEMSNNCKGSAAPSAQSAQCGRTATIQDACWNSQTG